MANQSQCSKWQRSLFIQSGPSLNRQILSRPSPTNYKLTHFGVFSTQEIFVEASVTHERRTLLHFSRCKCVSNISRLYGMTVINRRSYKSYSWSLFLLSRQDKKDVGEVSVFVHVPQYMQMKVSRRIKESIISCESNKY